MNATIAMNGSEVLVLDTLIRLGKLEASVIGEARDAINKAGGSPERALVRAGLVEDRVIADAYVEDMLLARLDPDEEESPVDKDLVEILPEKLCNDRLVVPLMIRDDALEMAFVSPDAMELVDELQLLTGMRIRLLLAPLSVVEAKLHALFRAGRTEEIGGKAGEFADPTAEEEEEEENPEDGLLILDAATAVGFHRSSCPDGQPDP